MDEVLISCRYCETPRAVLDDHYILCPQIRMAFDPDYWPFRDEKDGQTRGRQRKPSSTGCRICGGPRYKRSTLCSVHLADYQRQMYQEKKRGLLHRPIARPLRKIEMASRKNK